MRVFEVVIRNANFGVVLARDIFEAAEKMGFTNVEIQNAYLKKNQVAIATAWYNDNPCSLTEVRILEENPLVRKHGQPLKQKGTHPTEAQ